MTLRAATLADEQMSDAEAASVCLVPLPYTLPPTRYVASDVPWSIQEQQHEVQSVWALIHARQCCSSLDVGNAVATQHKRISLVLEVY